MDFLSLPCRITSIVQLHYASWKCWHVLLLKNNNCDSNLLEFYKMFWEVVDCPSFCYWFFQRCKHTGSASRILQFCHIFRFFSFLCAQPNAIYSLQILFSCWNQFVFSLITGWKNLSLISCVVDKYYSRKCPKLKCKFSFSYILLKVVLVYERYTYK